MERSVPLSGTPGTWAGRPETPSEPVAPVPQAAPALTQSMLATWDTPSIIRYADLAGAGVQQWELWCLPHHDLAKRHSLAK
jgi:hypothetical protein